MSEWLLPAYTGLTVLQLFVGLLLAIYPGSWDEEKLGARLVLTCWAWPVVLVIALVKGVLWLWDMAEWGARESR